MHVLATSALSVGKVSLDDAVYSWGFADHTCPAETSPCRTGNALKVKHLATSAIPIDKAKHLVTIALPAGKATPDDVVCN